MSRIVCRLICGNRTLFLYDCHAERAIIFLLYTTSLFLIHFNDIQLRVAEEAHIVGGADTACDEDAAVALEFIEPGGGG